MKPVDRSPGEASDSPGDCECFRCDRNVATADLFRLSIRPPAASSERFAGTDRFCCPDCVAGMGMLEFADQWVDRTPDA